MVRKKILFLDIDGPVVTMRWNNTMISVDRGSDYAGERPDQPTVEFLQYICKTFGYEIVISSCWRKGNQASLVRLIEKDNALKPYMYGFKNGRYDLKKCITPTLTNVNDHDRRCMEIDEWIMTNFGNRSEMDIIVVDDSELKMWRNNDTMCQNIHYERVDTYDGMGFFSMIRIKDFCEERMKLEEGE